MDSAPWRANSSVNHVKQYLGMECIVSEVKAHMDADCRGDLATEESLCVFNLV